MWFQTVTLLIRISEALCSNFSQDTDRPARSPVIIPAALSLTAISFPLAPNIIPSTLLSTIDVPPLVRRTTFHAHIEQQLQ